MVIGRTNSSKLKNPVQFNQVGTHTKTNNKVATIDATYHGGMGLFCASKEVLGNHAGAPLLEPSGSTPCVLAKSNWSERAGGAIKDFLISPLLSGTGGLLTYLSTSRDSCSRLKPDFFWYRDHVTKSVKHIYTLLKIPGITAFEVAHLAAWEYDRLVTLALETRESAIQLHRSTISTWRRLAYFWDCAVVHPTSEVYVRAEESLVAEFATFNHAYGLYEEGRARHELYKVVVQNMHEHPGTGFATFNALIFISIWYIYPWHLMNKRVQKYAHFLEKYELEVTPHYAGMALSQAVRWRDAYWPQIACLRLWFSLDRRFFTIYYKNYPDQIDPWTRHYSPYVLLIALCGAGLQCYSWCMQLLAGDVSSFTFIHVLYACLVLCFTLSWLDEEIALDVLKHRAAFIQLVNSRVIPVLPRLFAMIGVTTLLANAPAYVGLSYVLELPVMRCSIPGFNLSSLTSIYIYLGAPVILSVLVIYIFLTRELSHSLGFYVWNIYVLPTRSRLLYLGSCCRVVCHKLVHTLPPIRRLLQALAGLFSLVSEGLIPGTRRRNTQMLCRAVVMSHTWKPYMLFDMLRLDLLFRVSLFLGIAAVISLQPLYLADSAVMYYPIFALTGYDAVEIVLVVSVMYTSFSYVRCGYLQYAQHLNRPSTAGVPWEHRITLDYTPWFGPVMNLITLGLLFWVFYFESAVPVYLTEYLWAYNYKDAWWWPWRIRLTEEERRLLERRRFLKAASRRQRILMNEPDFQPLHSPWKAVWFNVCEHQALYGFDELDDWYRFKVLKPIYLKPEDEEDQMSNTRHRQIVAHRTFAARYTSRYMHMVKHISAYPVVEATYLGDQEFHNTVLYRVARISAIEATGLGAFLGVYGARGILHFLYRPYWVGMLRAVWDFFIPDALKPAIRFVWDDMCWTFPTLGRFFYKHATWLASKVYHFFRYYYSKTGLRKLLHYQYFRFWRYFRMHTGTVWAYNQVVDWVINPGITFFNFILSLFGSARDNSITRAVSRPVLYPEGHVYHKDYPRQHNFDGWIYSWIPSRVFNISFDEHYALDQRLWTMDMIRLRFISESFASRRRYVEDLPIWLGHGLYFPDHADTEFIKKRLPYTSFDTYIQRQRHPIVGKWGTVTQLVVGDQVWQAIKTGKASDQSRAEDIFEWYNYHPGQWYHLRSRYSNLRYFQYYNLTYKRNNWKLHYRRIRVRNEARPPLPEWHLKDIVW